MSDAPSYAPPVAIGETMVGGTVSRMLASKDPAFAAGDIVLSYSGWQTHEVAKGKSLRKLDTGGGSPSSFLGVLGMPGSTPTWDWPRSASRRREKQSSLRPPAGRSAPPSARSQGSEAHVPWASPAGRTNAPEAFFGLLEGRNFGKLVVRVKPK